MLIFPPLDKYCRMANFLLLGMICLIASPALGGAYGDSAHGNSVYGVNRSAVAGNLSGFASGNCAHCHEAHASIDGTEPYPADGPASHTLFADSFNTDRTLNSYLETDNFCFFCHSSAAGQQVKNQDYSTTFGGGSEGSGPQSIMDAFNLASYHNLYDIWNFLRSSPTYAVWFAKLGNPCSACHNSHLAKRNWDSGQTGFPLLGAISIPGVSGSLWGETEVMSAYFSYEAPYTISDSREPAGVGEQNGENTPDYIGFCSICHNQDNTIWSTTLNRELKKINWKLIGQNPDKHGEVSRNGTDHFREPYTSVAAFKNNFILSCLDCHESHGSENIMLLRRRINGEDLEGPIASTDAMSYACKRCHTDDLAAGAGTGEADHWEYVHHLVADAPYPQPGTCEGCHVSQAGGDPIPCGNCHGHGMDDSVLGASSALRKTF